MKIKSLHIDSYRHLENLHFDFTYPEGHAKAGLPLEKICIIGQSATGKTSILEVLKESAATLEKIETVNDEYIFSHFSLSEGFSGSIDYLSKDDLIKLTGSGAIKNGKEYFFGDSGGSIKNLVEEYVRLVYLTSEVISRSAINIFNQNPLKLLNDPFSEKAESVKDKFKANRYIYEFVQDVELKVWYSFLVEILDYRRRFSQMASELLNKGTIGDLNKLHKEYEKWSVANENPLKLFAKYLNPILVKLNLEIDLVNTEYSIPVKSKFNDEIIPISGLSTGTKGLLLSMFPLFELDTNDAIILIDEPERSLFPDMQIDLMSHYQRIAPNAQFVVATHSPFIAAAFEPEERFVLYFDEQGKVAVRKGESPIGDDPNDMLRNDFNVDYYNDFGKKAYKEYLDLKRKVAQETETEKKKELIVELAGLGDKYNF